MALEEPLVLALSCVECVGKQPPHLQGEAGSKLLQTRLFAIFSENVPVPPHEYKVTLVMEGDDVPANELWLVREEGPKQSPNAVPKARVKIVQNNLGDVPSGCSGALDLVPKLLGGELEAGCRSEGQMNRYKPVQSTSVRTCRHGNLYQFNSHVGSFPRLVKDEEVREAVLGSVPTDLLQVILACAAQACSRVVWQHQLY